MILSISPKLLVVGVGRGMGPVVVSGRGAGSDSGVIGVVISGAVGRSGAGRDGRLVKLFVPAFSPSGGAGGLEERPGFTETPGAERSSGEGVFVVMTGLLLAASRLAPAPTEMPC
jgi:hypothetical protein